MDTGQHVGVPGKLGAAGSWQQCWVRSDCSPSWPQNRPLTADRCCPPPCPDCPALPSRPVSETLWVNEDGESLPDFVAEAMSNYLKARVQL